MDHIACKAKKPVKSSGSWLFLRMLHDYFQPVPELPEVEILVRHLTPLLRGQTIRDVAIHRPKAVSPTREEELRSRLTGSKIVNLRRRGKYLLFELRARSRSQLTCLGHLGMTGRMYLQPVSRSLPKHVAVALDLGSSRFVFEDTRGFGRFNRGSMRQPADLPKGTGLGLALVDEHVRMHGGEVVVDDAPTGGARFVVRFPRIA